MTEYDVSAVDLSGVLNKSGEEKAKQVPDPATYHLLCMLPRAEEEMGVVGVEGVCRALRGRGDVDEDRHFVHE